MPLTENTNRKIIDDFVEQLKISYEAKAYYLTLMGTVSLIDICAALNEPSGETDRNVFKKWYETYLPSHCNDRDEPLGFSADDCYKFRCKLLHQGRAEGENKKMVFYVGDGHIHRCASNDFYYLDIERFMNDVISAACEWLDENQGVPHIDENFSKMIKINDRDPGGFVGGRGPFIS